MTSFDLIVLMIAAPGLRSALAARLTSMGENVMTISRKLNRAELDRLGGQNAVLVADKAMLDDNLSVVLADSGWRHVVILNGDGPGEPGDRSMRMRSENAIAEVTAALSRWRTSTPEE